MACNLNTHLSHKEKKNNKTNNASRLSDGNKLASDQYPDGTVSGLAVSVPRVFVSYSQMRNSFSPFLTWKILFFKL